MKSSSNEINGRRRTLAPLLGLGLALTAGSAMAEIDAEAQRVVRSMADYLGGLSALSVQADVDNEVIDLAGQKLQLTSSVELLLQRPDKLWMHRQGPFADAELTFDGKQISLLGKQLNAYLQIEAPGDIEAGIEAFRASTGLDAPGADLLFADPYPALTAAAHSAAYRGTAFVNGVECDYLTFRGDKADWQLWVQHGDTPLPMKYVITTKWMTGAPQYAVRFRNWDTQPKIAAERFIFSAPKGATKLDEISVDATGELMAEGGMQ